MLGSITNTTENAFLETLNGYLDVINPFYTGLQHKGLSEWMKNFPGGLSRLTLLKLVLLEAFHDTQNNQLTNLLIDSSESHAQILFESLPYFFGKVDHDHRGSTIGNAIAPLSPAVAEGVRSLLNFLARIKTSLHHSSILVSEVPLRLIDRLMLKIFIEAKRTVNDERVNPALRAAAAVFMSAFWLIHKTSKVSFLMTRAIVSPEVSMYKAFQRGPHTDLAMNKGWGWVLLSVMSTIIGWGLVAGPLVLQALDQNPTMAEGLERLGKTHAIMDLPDQADDYSWRFALGFLMGAILILKSIIKIGIHHAIESRNSVQIPALTSGNLDDLNARQSDGNDASGFQLSPAKVPSINSEHSSADSANIPGHQVVNFYSPAGSFDGSIGSQGSPVRKSNPNYTLVSRRLEYTAQI